MDLAAKEVIGCGALKRQPNLLCSLALFMAKLSPHESQSQY
jgi:hypothetical protein